MTLDTGSQPASRTRAPRDEIPRLRALARYSVLDTPPDPAFDEITELARLLSGAPVAGIAFRDADRVWFKSLLGLAIGQCGPEDFPDGRGDPGAEPVADGFAVGPHRFAAFASAPIVTSDGYALGELFVAGPHAGRFGPEVSPTLGILVRQVLTRLELRRTLLAYHTVVDGVGHVVFQLDEQDRLISVTPTWTQLTGYGAVRSAGRQLPEFAHPDDRQDVALRLRQLQAGEALPAFECRLGRLIGGEVPVEIIARPLVDEGGRQLGLVGVIADISERKAREVEAQHAQKLEALGRLSAGLAHEINTPMQFVGNNIRFLAESCGSLLETVRGYQQLLHSATVEGGPEGLREAALGLDADVDVEFLSEEIEPATHESLAGVERVSVLVRAMKQLSRPGQDSQSPTDLNEALLTVALVAESQVRYVAQIACELGALPLVTCNVGDLNQVFLNLLINAADAIAEKGGPGQVTLSSRAEQDVVVVTVSDNGTGIPDDIRMKIFEPFFTTKEVGKGTGQGLALARAIVHDKHSGSITVSSQPGVGSTFTVTLPVAGRPRTGRG